jgi:glycine/D-amino acid oxidase-like deaminating enzyme
MRKDLQAAQSYKEGLFDHAALSQSADKVWHYGDLSAERVIFCEGAAVTKNPFFPDLPMKPVKGETLAFSCPDLELPHSIFHNGKWLLPYGNKRFRIGATYDELDLTEKPTAAAKTTLLEGLSQLLTEVPPLKVEQHLAGLRPSTVDARPILGAHPAAQGLYLLNGLGSKGASLAPLMTRQFQDFLLHDAPLDPETDLKRFHPQA